MADAILWAAKEARIKDIREDCTRRAADFSTWGEHPYVVMPGETHRIHVAKFR